MKIFHGETKLDFGKQFQIRHIFVSAQHERYISYLIIILYGTNVQITEHLRNTLKIHACKNKYVATHVWPYIKYICIIINYNIH